MNPIEWTLTETFHFPTEYGKVVGANDVKVTAGYENQQTDEAIRLTGIYHIAANVTFDGNASDELKKPNVDAILIDDVDTKESTGYFEYAVPLLIDLPATDVTDIAATVTDATAKATEDGELSIMWTVQASMKEPVVKEVAVPVETEKQEKANSEKVELEVASHEHEVLDDESSSLRIENIADKNDEMHEMLMFIHDLEDGVTITPFTLNNVFVK